MYLTYILYAEVFAVCSLTAGGGFTPSPSFRFFLTPPPLCWYVDIQLCHGRGLLPPSPSFCFLLTPPPIGGLCSSSRAFQPCASGFRPLPQFLLSPDPSPYSLQGSGIWHQGSGVREQVSGFKSPSCLDPYPFNVEQA